MEKINETLLFELRRIVTNCAVKREMFLQSALSKSKTKKILNITSGSLALLSAGAITAVLTVYLGDKILQIVAALTAAISGFISLLLTSYFVEEETSKIFEGASKYLSLRDKSYRMLINPNSSNEQIFKDLEILLNEYAQLDESYAKYLKAKIFTAPDSTYISQIPQGISTKDKNIEKAYNAEMGNFEKEVTLLKSKISSK